VGRAELLARARRSLPGRWASRFVGDECPNLAVLIAWNLMFAAFPLAIVTAGILGYLLRLDNLLIGTSHLPTSVQLRQDILALIPGLDADKVLTPLRQRSGVLLIVGGLGLLWTGTGLFGAMEQAFGRAYRVRPRPFLQGKLMAAAMVLLFAPAAGLVIGSGSLLGGLSALPFLPAAFLSAAAPLLQVVFAVIAGTALFLLVYTVVPNRELHPTQAWPGALLAGVLMELLTLAFPVYANINRGFTGFGRSFGLLFLLLTFFYFLGMVTMAGAELNATLIDARD
jgi:membrane protein